MWLPINQSPNPRRGGLTLVELLLAITVFSGVMAVAGGFLDSAMRLQTRWGDTTKPYQQMARAFARLEQDLESARPFFGVPFTGTESRLEFARVEGVLRGETGPSTEWVRVSYRLEGGAEGMSLVREESVWRPGEEGVEPPQRETLMSLGHGRFAFAVLDPQGQRAWVNAWDGRAHGIPRLIKFDCTLPMSAGQTPVDFSRVMRNPAGTLPTMEEGS